jgi:hypothetical protein
VWQLERDFEADETCRSLNTNAKELNDKKGGDSPITWNLKSHYFVSIAGICWERIP